MEASVAKRAPRRQEFSDSLLDISLGRFGGWQMNLAPGQGAAENVEVRDRDGVLLSRVEGASLGAVEADVLTWTLARWVRSGVPADGAVSTTLYQVAQALYGENKGRDGGKRVINGGDRQRVLKALLNLRRANIVLRDPDAAEKGETLFDNVSFIRRLRYGKHLQDLMDGDGANEALQAAMAGERDETITIFIDPYVMERAGDHTVRAWLDWPIQRRLGAGMGKRLWLFLEAARLYEPLGEVGGVEYADFPLTERLYTILGANCNERSDNRKAIRRGLERIIEVDDRYLTAGGPTGGCELIVGRSGRPDTLRIVRRQRAQQDSVVLSARTVA